jgi:hypothetical protein
MKKKRRIGEGEKEGDEEKHLHEIPLNALHTDKLGKKKGRTENREREREGEA